MANLLDFPCPNCSSELNYDAETKDLKCLHCATVFPIAQSGTLIKESGIREFLNAMETPLAELKEVCYKCKKCGQETRTKESVAFFECSNCGYNVVNPEAYKTRAITPSAIIPFAVTKNQAMDIFKNWISKGFWNDTSLKSLSLIDNLVGHYIPFWTFDALTENEWSGESGTYYYTTRTYKDANGNEQTEQERHTSWQFRSGSFTEFFDDILVCGTKEISEEYIQEVYPFDLQALVPIDDKYLLGWQAQAFDEEMNSNYEYAQQHIHAVVRKKSIELLCDDEYRSLEVNTNFSNETFKHIILPLWFCQYLFKGKKYSFIVNGQTGKIYGKKPLSASKIASAIILALIVIGALIYFYNK